MRTFLLLKHALQLRPVSASIALAVMLSSSAPSHCTTIEDAAAADDVVTLRAMLEANPALALAKEGDGTTLLHVAAATGWRELVLLLLVNHANVNAKDAHGAARLHAAVFYKREETATLLIAQHA